MRLAVCDFIIAGFTVQQRRQPLQNQQDDEDPDVCAHPQPDPAGSGVPARPLLQRSGKSGFNLQLI